VSEYSASPLDDLALDGGPMPSPLPPPVPGTMLSDDPHREAKRLQRLAEGVRGIRTGGGTLKLNERILMVLAGIIAPLGLIMVLLGWWGASRTPNLFEQIPYLISGGLLGLGFVFLGAFFYFAHWLTELVKEHRAQSAAVIDAITRLETAITTSSGSLFGAANNGGAPALAAIPDDVLLVATERGSMAHRVDCVVVAGKSGLKAVTLDDDLAACKLCDPYAPAPV
jgi:hypothetical protein